MFRRLAILFCCAVVVTASEPLELDLRRGHQSTIERVVLVESQRLLLSDDGGGTICAWDMQSRLLRWQIEVAGLWRYALSADGQHLLLSVGYRIELRSLRDGSRLRNVNAYQVFTGDGMRPGSVESVAFSRDGRWIIAQGPQLDSDRITDDPATHMQVDWFPIDAALARQRDSEPGAVGTDDIDEMEEPAQSVRGDFWGFDAAGRVLVWGGGVVRAVPDPGAGEPQVVASPSDTSALPFPGGRLDFSESSRFVWTPTGGQRQVHAVMSRLPNTSVILPDSLNWFSRDGLLVATGSDWDGGDLIGAVWRWRLPDCTPLPVLTVPGTRRLFAVGELLFAAAIPPQEPPEEGGPRGMRLDLLTWGPEATPGPGLPFACLSSLR
jgi:WD40 repeat protein